MRESRRPAFHAYFLSQAGIGSMVIRQVLCSLRVLTRCSSRVQYVVTSSRRLLMDSLDTPSRSVRSTHQVASEATFGASCQATRPFPYSDDLASISHTSRVYPP